MTQLLAHITETPCTQARLDCSLIIIHHTSPVADLKIQNSEVHALV
jgi:hypothetical protein